MIKGLLVGWLVILLLDYAIFTTENAWPWYMAVFLYLLVVLIWSNLLFRVIHDKYP